MISSHPSFERWLGDRSQENRSLVIEEHQYLCRRAARKFLRRGVDRADLEQVAVIGLIKAVDRYNGTRETPFEAYAWPLVLGELMHYVRDSERAIRAPRRVRELDRKFSVAERELCSILGRDPSVAEVAARIGVDSRDQREIALFRESGTSVSVEDLRPSEHRRLAYTIDAQLDVSCIAESFALLNPVERTIVRAIYEYDTPTSDLAAQLGYSRRHIARMHTIALRKLSRAVGPVAD